jgi:hypothetical protein
MSRRGALLGFALVVAGCAPAGSSDDSGAGDGAGVDAAMGGGGPDAGANDLAMAAADLSTPSGKVPIFIAQGQLGRTIVSCDDGNSWVGNHSWDIDGDPLMCGIKQNVVCGQTNPPCSYFFDNQCVQLACCDDTPDIPENVAFGNGIFAGAWGHGKPGVLRSSGNGIDWVSRDLDIKDSNIAFGNGRFVAASNGASYWSTDGINWSDGGKTSFNTMGSPVRAIGYGDYDGGGRFVSLSAGSGRDIQVSSDGGMSWWRPMSIPDDCALGVGSPGGDILGGNGVLLIVDRQGNACRSTDGGETWTVSPTGLTSIASQGVWTGSKFLFWGGDNAIGPATAMIESADGDKWMATPMVTATRIGPIARGDSGTFVAMPWIYSGYAMQQFMRSTDGVTWQKLPTTAFVQSHNIFRMSFGYADASATCPAP